MSEIKNHKAVSAFIAYSMYLLTGASCVVIGSSIPSLMSHYNKGIASIAALASVFAIGRVITVFPMGIFTEKFGVKSTATIGVVCFLLFLFGAPITKNYFAAMVLSFLAGAGMSTQDTSCAVILKYVFPNSYSSALSAGQAFFNTGCFLSPLFMGIALLNRIDFKFVYFAIALIGVAMLIVLPFMKDLKKIKNTCMLESEMFEDFSHETVIFKNKKLAYALLGIMCFSYFGVTNTIHTYTPVFIESFGISESLSVTILTVYGIGSMIGSFVFIQIFRKVHETKVIWINILLTLFSLLTAFMFKTVFVFFIAYFIAGFFCGVIFSILVSVSVSLKPLNTAVAAATVGFLGGGADISSPLITGALINITNIHFTFYYIIAMCVICFLSSYAYRFIYKRRI